MAPTGILSTDLATRLAARTLELIDIASESGAERNIAGHVLEVLRDGGVPARDAGDTCVLAGSTSRSERPLVLLAGHFDTVPAQGNLPGCVSATGEHVEGLGACDMKGGVAVMIELALAAAPSDLDVGYVLFGREELPAAQGALGPLLAREPGLREADLAIVLEPTANTVQAGCLGNLDAAWTFHGRAGHSARPWLADNAINRAAAGVRALHAIGPFPRTLDGLDFTEVVSVTTLHAGVARNVIPGEARANVNFRYAPDVGAAQAERTLRGWCEPHGEIELLCNTPGARPPRANPLLERLLAAGGGSVEAKQAWTPVAEFAAAGIEAVNFGPGDPAFAHRPDERVATAALVRAYRVLESFLCA
ncbi:MAG TPA: succinyl-diaminopimelate desuccinylase [Solirubrobacteraceae bacterium]|jgi:succinyl-diaminopimelate desuccinylase|nr:succinyl-diaminopimelate desuccinylase [Solirubrobacteraceae bacterium]